jgi:hypothetical protein
MNIFTTHKEDIWLKDTMQVYQKPEKGMQINDKNTITKNKLFDLIVKHDSQ